MGAFFRNSSEARLLLGGQATETLVELVYAAAARNFFLLAGVERVALGAHVQVQIFTDGEKVLMTLPQEHLAVMAT